MQFILTSPTYDVKKKWLSPFQLKYEGFSITSKVKYNIVLRRLRHSNTFWSLYVSGRQGELYVNNRPVAPISLNVKMRSGLQEGVEMYFHCWTCFILRNKLVTAPGLKARATGGMKVRADIDRLICSASGESQVQSGPLFPLTYIKQFYGRRRQKSPQSLHGGQSCIQRPGAVNGCMPKLREQLWMMLIFCHTFLICPAPAKHLPDVLRHLKGHSGQMSPLYTRTFI